MGISICTSKSPIGVSTTFKPVLESVLAVPILVSTRTISNPPGF